MACPARAMPEAGAQSAALERCVPDADFLRLGVHTSSSPSRTQQSLHGVATAVRFVNQGGLLAEWNTTIVPFYKPILDDPIWTNAQAVKVSSGTRRVERLLPAWARLTLSHPSSRLLGGPRAGAARHDQRRGRRRHVLRHDAGPGAQGRRPRRPRVPTDARTSPPTPPQYVFSLAGIPQVGFSATAPSLSNSTVYPTFSRVVPSDVSQGQLLAELVAALGWKYVSVLSSTDVYSQELSAVFRVSCRDLGIILVTEQSFSATSTVRELGSDMEDLKAAKANVRLLVAGSEEIAMVALQAAYEAGLSGPNEVWLGVDGGCTGFAGCGGAPPPHARGLTRRPTRPTGWFSKDLQAKVVGNTGIQKTLDGGLGLTPFVSRIGPLYEEFVEQWKATLPVQEADAPDSLVCELACLNETPRWEVGGGGHTQRRPRPTPGTDSGD